MEVIVAGYNTTVGDNLSPEIISASYARVSRLPQTIPEIREDAKKDVEKARKSNTNIVFGIGHSSIAEHTVFNIDIIGVSRYLVEEIESHRLASYTEKSQRYVLFEGDYTIPEELKIFPKYEKEFVNLIETQNNFYLELYPILLEYFKQNNLDKYKNDQKTVEGWAKEDARYIISMATQTQLGMTISARNLELMIRRLRATNGHEAKELAEKLYFEAFKIAPSLFPYTMPSKMELKNKQISHAQQSTTGYSDNVVLLNFDEQNKDSDIFEVLDNTKIVNLFKCMNAYDSAPREFEVVDFKYSLITSASCYAQLKRHRMMTIIPKAYNINYPPIIPKSVIETKMEKKFLEIIEKTNDFFKKTRSYYCLTNSHCREVYVKINLRELYHFCRMRMDGHAQWEIRDIANKMCEEAKFICPIGMTLCCGKDKFNEVYKSIFGDI